MKFLLLIYSEPALLDAMPSAEFDATMRGCIEHADDLKRDGYLIESQQLEPASTARSIRVRNGRQTILDGPFAETKEMLAGFNLIEAADIEEATRIAAEFPWTRTGCVEIRAVKDFAAVRERVGAVAR